MGFSLKKCEHPSCDATFAPRGSGRSEKRHCSKDCWKARNREQEAAYMAAWRKEHREEIAAYNRAYRPTIVPAIATSYR